MHFEYNGSVTYSHFVQISVNHFERIMKCGTLDIPGGTDSFVWPWTHTRKTLKLYTVARISDSFNFHQVHGSNETAKASITYDYTCLET